MPGGVGHFLNHLGRWEATAQGIRPPRGETERPRRLSNGPPTVNDAPPSQGGQLLSQTHAEFTLYGISALASVQVRDAGGQTQAIAGHTSSCEPQRTTTNTKTKTNSPSLSLDSRQLEHCSYYCARACCCCNFLWRHRPPPPKAPSPSCQSAPSCLPVTPPPSHPDFICVRRRARLVGRQLTLRLSASTVRGGGRLCGRRPPI